MSRGDEPQPGDLSQAKPPPPPPLVAQALARAQQLVDTHPGDHYPVSWAVEADQVGDMSVLMVWLAALRHEPAAELSAEPEPGGNEQSRGEEAQRDEEQP